MRNDGILAIMKEPTINLSPRNRQRPVIFICLLLGLLLIIFTAARLSGPVDDPSPEIALTRRQTRAGMAAFPTMTEVRSATSTTAPTRAAAPTIRPTVLTPSATTVPTTTPTPTTPPLPWRAEQLLGYSVQGEPIMSYRFGTGPRWFAVLGAIHGGHECNTFGLMEALIQRLGRPETESKPALIPADVTLYMVPAVNPDGCTMDTRPNARGVDLNRNWRTDDWVADANGPFGIVAGSGGPYPLSEPETLAISQWLLTLQKQSLSGPVRVVSYHSAVPNTGLVQPAYGLNGQPEPQSSAMAELYAAVADYRYSVTWVGNYDTTGEFIHWAGLNGFIAIDVELPDREPANTIPFGWPTNHIETNLAALLAILE